MRLLMIISLSLYCLACSQAPDSRNRTKAADSDALYSTAATERAVQFQAEFRSNESRIEDLNFDDLQAQIHATVKYLFGTLTENKIGGPQKGEVIELLLEKARIENGRVVVPYLYKATWLIAKTDLVNLSLPLPYSEQDLRTPKWQNCTDSAPEHREWSFFWYFWLPSRSGCDHVLGQQYQQVNVTVGNETPQTTLSYPEYSRMIHVINGVPTLSMTFAFGYVEDISNPKPFRDRDEGARAFQSFYTTAKKKLTRLGFTETPISLKDFGQDNSNQMGSRFVGIQDGVQLRINVVSNAGIDQMDLFAHSFAKDHDAFFGWFGHSRVGSGFDAQLFNNQLLSDPTTFSMTSEYQLIYWAGCNSYSYYTNPFFDLKAQLNRATDPHGTKNLDVISNGLPSLFSYNAYNAEVLLSALLNFKTPTSYQQIVNSIESKPASEGDKVLVNVLGDEDNGN